MLSVNPKSCLKQQKAVCYCSVISQNIVNTKGAGIVLRIFHKLSCAWLEGMVVIMYDLFVIAIST